MFGNKESYARSSGSFLTSKNKRGWIRILEATISVLIISGVLIFVYSRQPTSGSDSADYFNSLQSEILSDISFRSDLRLNVLNADDNNPDDPDYVALNDFVYSKITGIVDFYISICDLGSDTDFCKMNTDTYRATKDKNVFVQDVIISSDLGTGGDAQYKPRMLRLFMWEK